MNRRKNRIARIAPAGIVTTLGDGDQFLENFDLAFACRIADENLDAADLSRLWLHQANKGMNDLIGAKVLGRTPEPAEQPNILQDYANTSSAGSMIAFSKYNDDLKPGDYGVICSFGAGYSAGSVIVRKAA